MINLLYFIFIFEFGGDFCGQKNKDRSIELLRNLEYKWLFCLDWPALVSRPPNFIQLREFVCGVMRGEGQKAGRGRGHAQCHHTMDPTPQNSDDTTLVSGARGNRGGWTERGGPS